MYLFFHPSIESIGGGGVIEFAKSGGGSLSSRGMEGSFLRPIDTKKQRGFRVASVHYVAHLQGILVVVFKS